MKKAYRSIQKNISGSIQALKMKADNLASTRSEIKYAKEHRKVIEYLEKVGEDN